MRHRSSSLALVLALLVACRSEGGSPRESAGDKLDATEHAPPAAAEANPPAVTNVSGDGGGRPLLTYPPPTPNGAPEVQLIGRFDYRDAAAPECAWPGCRAIARFSGTQVSVKLEERSAAWMEGAPSHWDVAIDGVLQPKLVLSPGVHDYVLATGLPHGDHVVELYKRTEAQNGTTKFRGYDFAGGMLLAPPARRTRRIEVIGDSGIAGFGIEGEGADCPGPDWGSQWQNFRAAMGEQLGGALDAEVQGTVYSGKGMAKNIWHPDTDTMPRLFPRALPNDPSSTWDFSRYVPDVVVIMIGGNDFAIGQPVDEGPATLAEFTEAYDAFVVKLRAVYPAAYVFLAVSPSVSDAEPAGRSSRTNVLAGVEDVVARRADARVSSVVPPIAQPSELTACNGHGNAAYHRRLAADVAAAVRAKTGW